MSRLTELIQELCPNGVEFKKIKEVYQRLKGTPITASKMKEIENPQGEIRIFAGGKTVINAKEIDIPNANITRVPAVLVQSRGVIDAVYYDKPFTFKNEMWAYTAENPIAVKFLYYVLKNNMEYFRSAAAGMGSLPQISLPVTEDFEIPVPPLEIQREIVRILDTFTELTAEITAELTAELTARKQQYAYYRDNLLTFRVDITRKSLDELCTISAAGDAPKDALSLTKTAEYQIPVISNGIGENAFYGYTDKPKITEPAVTVAARGTIGYAEYRDYPYYPIIRLLSVIPKNTAVLATKYLYYCMQGKKYNVPLGGIPQLTAPELKKVVIPVPPLPVQQRIVTVLDNFDAICSDLNIGLPAEIEARKKQYEFYRDQLLTFAAQDEIVLTDRQTDEYNALIRLCQYVFGYFPVKLSDISVNCDSQRKPVTSANREAGDIPYYGASGIVDHVKDYIFDGNYLLISEDGANLLARNTPIAFSISGKTWVNNHAHILRFDNPITQKYVEIYLNAIDLSPYISGGAQPKLNQQNLYKIPIPLPPFQRQKEIVEILDHFSTLCTDLTSGLPAEIEARKKQYEYYRDNLLSFTPAD